MASARLAHAQLGTAADEAAIRKILDARNAADSNHDPRRLPQPMPQVLIWVTGTGWVILGAAEIDKNYLDVSTILSQLFRDSLLLGILSQAGDAGDVASASGGG